LKFKKRYTLAGILLLIHSTTFTSGLHAEETSTTNEQKVQKKPKPKKSSVSEKYQDKRKSGSFVLSPGIYRSTDAKSFGYEVSFLYNGYGPVIGFEKDKFKYAELEYASIFLSLGFGVRKVEKKKEQETGENATQVTLALPFFPLFPYARWMFDDPERSREIGFMLKIPTSWGKSKNEDND
jgi:hypothetical protein